MPYADPEVQREYHKLYKRRNRWRYRDRQKVYDAAKHANERAARYGRPGTITPEEVAELLAPGVCGHCGAEAEVQVDHRVPLCEPNSTNEFANLIASCDPCNSQKAAKPSVAAWSRRHSSCIECGTTERSHAARGLCSRCYYRKFERTFPSRRRRT